MSSILIRPFAATALLLAAVSPVIAAPKIGVLLKAPASSSGYWAAVEKGAVQAGQQLGAEVVVKAPPSESDIGLQIRLLNALAAQGAQAIVIAPINQQALAVPITSIAVHGIKVVIIDTPLTGKAAPVFIGTDQAAAGKAAGELLAKLTADSDEVAVLRHLQASGATQDRENAAIAAYRAAHPKSPIHADVYASSEPGKEVQKAKLLLTEHPGTKAVVAGGSPGSLAMLKVVQESNLVGKLKLIGFGFNLPPDIATAIDSGAMTAWIAQLPEEMGSKGVAAAVSLLKGESVSAVVNTPFIVITKDNLNDPKVQALLKL